MLQWTGSKLNPNSLEKYGRASTDFIALSTNTIFPTPYMKENSAAYLVLRSSDLA